MQRVYRSLRSSRAKPAQTQPKWTPQPGRHGMRFSGLALEKDTKTCQGPAVLKLVETCCVFRLHRYNLLHSYTQQKPFAVPSCTFATAAVNMTVQNRERSKALEAFSQDDHAAPPRSGCDPGDDRGICACPCTIAAARARQLPRGQIGFVPICISADVLLQDL